MKSKHLENRKEHLVIKNKVAEVKNSIGGLEAKIEEIYHMEQKDKEIENRK